MPTHRLDEPVISSRTRNSDGQKNETGELMTGRPGVANTCMRTHVHTRVRAHTHTCAHTQQAVEYVVIMHELKLV